MTVLQSDTAEPVRSEYGTVEVVAPGPLGERGRLRSEPLAYVAESAPGTVVLNVVSDLIPCAVTVEEVDAEPDGEPVATVPVMESGPVVVWQPGGNPHRMGVELAPGRYRVWVEVETGNAPSSYKRNGTTTQLRRSCRPPNDSGSPTSERSNDGLLARIVHD